MGNQGSSQPTTLATNYVRLGILGCARINKQAILAPIKKVNNVKLVGIASRSAQKASDYAKIHGIPKSFGSYEELLADKEIDAVYIPLPNGMHHEWTMKALAAGKHVLCEKPLCNNEKEAIEMRDEAIKRNLVLVEAFHWMFHPLAKRMREILDSGEIGKIQSAFACMEMPAYFRFFFSEVSADDIRFKYELGGGIMMDAGCYALSAVRWAIGKEPKEVKEAKPVLMYPQVDQRMEAILDFGDGITGHFVADFRSTKKIPAISLIVKGDKGTMSCTNFAAPHIFHSLRIESNGTSRTEKCYGEGTTYWYQLKSFADEVLGGPKGPSTLENSINNMKVIDQVYQKAGLKLRGLPLEEKTEEKKEENKVLTEQTTTLEEVDTK